MVEQSLFVSQIELNDFAGVLSVLGYQRRSLKKQKYLYLELHKLKVRGFQLK